MLYAAEIMLDDAEIMLNDAEVLRLIFDEAFATRTLQSVFIH